MANYPNHLIGIVLIVALVGFAGIFIAPNFEENIAGSAFSRTLQINADSIPNPASYREYLPLYRFWSGELGDHFYTTNEIEKTVVEKGRIYRFERIEAHILAKQKTGTQALHRFWNPRLNDHFYTANQQEAEILKNDNNWRYEGVIGYVHTSQTENTVPIYRFFNPKINDHFYTISENAKKNPPGDWLYKGVAGYVYATIPNSTCAEIGGKICAQNEYCSTSYIKVSDTQRCCPEECLQQIQTCADQGGSICPPPNICNGTNIEASDTNYCCAGACSVPTIEKEVAAPWSIKFSGTGQEIKLHFGEYGDTPVPGDYDGDGVTDLAVWRKYDKDEYRGPYSEWIIKRSSDDQVITIPWGNPTGDLPAHADYDGDGITDVAVARESDNTWHIRLSGGGTRTEVFMPYPDDAFFFNWKKEPDHYSVYPAPADYDGDSFADLAYFRPVNAEWKIKQSSNGQLITQTYGQHAREYDMFYDFGTPGDYNGDGTDELAVWRASSETWHVKNGQSVSQGYRLETPVPGDYNGDGKDDFATFARKPRFTSTFLAGDLTDGHTGYDYQPSIMQDGNTIRAWWCGRSPTGKLDAVFYASSTSPTTKFTNIQILDDGGCDVAAIKLPGSMSNRCNGNPVYYVYYEGDNMAYTYNHDGTVRSRTPQRDGNKILGQWSCDGQNWNEIGRVLDSTGYFAPQGQNVPYGKGHPNTILVDGVLYMTYFYEAQNTGGQMRLATSTNGEDFVEIDDSVAITVGGRVQYMDFANIYIGTAIQGLENPPLLYFSKDLGSIENFIPNKQYFDSKDFYRISNSPKECSWGGRLMTNPAGIMESESVIYYGAEWDKGPAGICEHNIDPDFSIDGSELYSARIDFEIEESKCLGSKYRGCNNGGTQSRTCTSTGWGAWNTCIHVN